MRKPVEEIIWAGDTMSYLRNISAIERNGTRLLPKAMREAYQKILGALLRQARGISGDDPGRRWRLKTKKTAISRIENHAEDIKLSMLERVAEAWARDCAYRWSSGRGSGGRALKKTSAQAGVQKVSDLRGSEAKGHLYVAEKKS